MNKKFMSIIAAATVMISGSPMIANALYTEVITKQDRSEYTKIDFMSDAKTTIYIYNGDNTDPEEPYRRRGIQEYKLKDRIYLNIKEGSTASDVGALLKEFRTEEGNGLQIYSNNFFNKQYGYYFRPTVYEENDYLGRISVNDARRIKEILAQSDIVTDVIYSDSVCNPAEGAIDLTLYQVPYTVAKDKTSEEVRAYTAEMAEQILECVNYQGIDATVNTGKVDVRVIPENQLSLTEQIEMAENIYKELKLVPYMLWTASTEESFGGIDLMNAVDGDSNCDEQMDMADAVLIMQSLANPDKYQLTAQGKFNADLNGDGITVGDAQTIQKKLLGLE